MGKILFREDPDIPVLLPETANMFCKGFIHEKEFPREWLEEGLTHVPKHLMETFSFSISFVSH